MIAASGRFDLAFTCTDSTGAPVAPTGTPTGTLVKNGTDLGTTVTVTMSTAQGIASCTIPSDAANGDRFYLRVSAVISAVTYVLSGPVSTISNSVAQTGDSFARIGAAGASLTALGDTRLANLDAAVSTRATPTNITAGTITTVTNLTNAPTTGDLTATMKASVTAAVPSVTAIRTELDTNSTQLAAILSAILATNNLSSLANIYGPGVMEIPASGSRVFKFTLAIKDAEGKAVNLDSLPTITVTNESGTSRAAGLSSVTAVTTGKYTFTYTQSSSAASEQLTFESAGTVSGEARPAYWVAVVADYDATSMLVAIDAALALVKAKTDNLPGSPAAVGSAMTLTSAYDPAKTAAPTAAAIRTEMDSNSTQLAKLGTPAGASISADIAAVKTDTGNLVTRITANLFSGITYMKNWLGTLAGKTADATTLAEVNATTAGASYSNTTDSLEALRDRGDVAWAGSGGGMTGAYAITITVTDGTSPVPGALVRLKAGAAEDLKKTNGSGVAVFSADNNTYSVRITAEELTFTPVSLVVTGDTSQTYAMTAVSVDDTAWATGDDLVAYSDVSTIGQMLRDDNTKVAAVDVPTNAIVVRMLKLATGHINSALSVSKRYSHEQLAALDESGREHLRWLCCSIAYWHICQRRGSVDPEKQGRNLKVIDDHLDRLRRGETVLGPEAQAAGIGEAVEFSSADVQRGSPLLRDRMSGTQGVFPNRRYNPRQGQ